MWIRGKGNQKWSVSACQGLITCFAPILMIDFWHHRLWLNENNKHVSISEQTKKKKRSYTSSQLKLGFDSQKKLQMKLLILSKAIMAPQLMKTGQLRSVFMIICESDYLRNERMGLTGTPCCWSSCPHRWLDAATLSRCCRVHASLSHGRSDRTSCGE